MNSNSSIPNFGRFRVVLRKWPILGMFAGVTWFLLLAIGVLVPAEDYRKVLGWVPDSEKQDEQKKLLTEVETLIKKNVPTSETKPNDSKPVDPATNQAPIICSLCGKSTTGDDDPCYRCRVNDRNRLSIIGPFAIAAVSFLPLNICLLTVFAAFIGGCAIDKGELKYLKKLVEEHLDSGGKDTPETDRNRRRYNYLAEHPAYSALRGLVVFLVLVSGLLVAGSNSIIVEGSQTEQLTQYFRLAGIFSFFGYLAGSDPTVFASIIEFGSSRIRKSDTNTPGAPAGPIDTAIDNATAKAVDSKAAADKAADKAAETLKAVQAVGDATDEVPKDDNGVSKDTPNEADQPRTKKPDEGRGG